MDAILGMEYSDTREDEYGDTEYFIDVFDEWYTEEDLKERLEEEEYWTSEDRNREWNPYDG